MQSNQIEIFSVGNATLYNIPMQSPKRAAKTHIERYSRQNMLTKHRRPAQIRETLCSRSPFTLLRSARNPAKILPPVFVVPGTHTLTHVTSLHVKEK